MDSKQQTLRMTGLPPLTQTEDVKEFFADRINRGGRQILEFVGTINQVAMSSSKQTTVTFSSHVAAKQALGLEQAHRHFRARSGGAAHISLNHTFEGITTLHSCANPETGRPDIDVVSLHGLTGHAWNTFTTSDLVDSQAGRIKEYNWLRDSVPQLLENQGIYSRVMSFGYNADVWMTKSDADLSVPVDQLIHNLDYERQQDPQRPLFFVGHSLGGIIVKDAIVTLANRAMIRAGDPISVSQGQHIFPVKGCLFFGVPHKGAEVAEKALLFLSLLSHVFNVNKKNVQDLKSKSQRFANISSQFRAVQSDHDIPVISFFETVKYKRYGKLIVEKESAIYDYPACPRPFGINRDHKDMVKFSNDDDQALRSASHILASYASNAIAQRNARSRPVIAPPPPRAPVTREGYAEEDVFGKLADYDTVFLVDDSPSMQGEKWQLVQEILHYSTVVATRYDTNGIDVHFMNNLDANEDDIKDPAIVVKILRGIELKGNTPTLDRLSRHLKGYLKDYKASDYSVNHRGYNLIVLTDGEPNTEYESGTDESDQEDVRNHKVAFRLIRKKIVEVAKKLDDEESESGQVGIQFCQIGNDHDATEFFEYLDDRLKRAHKLKRDMVDTIPCQSVSDLTENFFKKLLLGAIHKGYDREKIEIQQPVRGRQEPTSLSYRSRTQNNGKERQWSDDETIVAPSSRFNSIRIPRTSTMPSLSESPVDGAPSSPASKKRPTGMVPSREASSASAGVGPPHRHTTFAHPISETEEPGLKNLARSSTERSSWYSSWKSRSS